MQHKHINKSPLWFFIIVYILGNYKNNFEVAMTIEIGKQYILDTDLLTDANGKVVTVVNYGPKKGEGFICPYNNVYAVCFEDDLYEIDMEVLCRSRFTDKFRYTHYVRKSSLRPIDDESRQVVDWLDMKDIWTPNELTVS